MNIVVWIYRNGYHCLFTSMLQFVCAFPPTENLSNFWGAMIQGQRTCGTFQSFKLTYLNKLRAGMIYIILWYVLTPEQT